MQFARTTCAIFGENARWGELLFARTRDAYMEMPPFPLYEIRNVCEVEEKELYSQKTRLEYDN